jgi:adenosylcobinamide-phosphate synthase
MISTLAVVITLSGALILDLTLGDPPNSLHPVAWMGRYIDLFWRCRPGIDKAREIQFIYGISLVLSGAVLFSLPWIIFIYLNIPLLWLWSIPFLKVAFAVRGLVIAGNKIRRSLANADLEEARRLVGRHMVSRRTDGLSSTEVASAAIESLAENITDGITAPLLFFAIFGIPGAWAYRFCNTCDSMVGYRDAEHEYQGKFAAWLDMALNWLPARLTGLLIVFAAYLSGEDSRTGWLTMISQHRRTPSPNAGWSIAAMAGALGVRLEKAGYYRLEGGNRNPDGQVIKRSIRVVWWATALVFFITLFIIVVLHGCT